MNKRLLIITAIVSLFISSAAVAAGYGYAVVLNVQGYALLESTGGVKTRIRSGMNVLRSDKIVTMNNAQVLVKIHNFGVFKLKENSEINVHKIVRHSGDLNLALDKGNIILHIKQLKDDEDVSIYTPNAICAVRGTSFAVSTDKRKTYVAVADGEVRTAPKDDASKEVSVLAGEISTLSDSDVEETSLITDKKLIELGIADFKADVKDMKVELGTSLEGSTLKLKSVLKGHKEIVTGVRYLEGGNKAVSCSYDGSIKLWNMKTTELIDTIDYHDSPVNRVNVSSDGRSFVSAGEDGKLALFDSSGTVLYERSVSAGGVNNAVISHDGNYIAAAADGGIIEMIKIEDKSVSSLKAGSTDIWSVAFSKDSRYLAAGTSTGKVLVFNTANGELVKKLDAHKGGVVSLEFAARGGELVSAGHDGMIKLWTSSFSLKKTIEAHESFIMGMDLSDDGKYIASSSDDNTVKVWSISGSLLRVLSGHEHGVVDVYFKDDSSSLISGSKDSSVRLWDLKY